MALEAVATVIVTGGSSGIGESFIRRLHTLKSGLVFCNLSRSEPALKLPGSHILHLQCDLGVREQLLAGAEKAMELARSRPGRILLINNSGFASYGRFPAPDLERSLEMIEVNARAPVHLTGLLLPLLRERGGIIINVASTTAFQPTPYMATYGATKAFLLHWSLGLAEDLRDDGVEVLALCPGPTATRFFSRAGVGGAGGAAARRQSPEEVVEAALDALGRRRRLVVSGFLNQLMTGASSRLPKTLAARISGMLIRRFRMEKTTPNP